MKSSGFRIVQDSTVPRFGMDLGAVISIYKKKFAMPTTMTTLSGVLETLRLKKQDNEFIMAEAGFGSPSGKTYQPEELTIIKTYRFEGDSDPSDNSILYLIEANDGFTGYSIDVYGAESNHDDDRYDEFIRKINVSERDFQAGEKNV